MKTTTPGDRAEQAGHAEAVATLNAMWTCRARFQRGEGVHPAALLASLLAEVGNHEGPHPERFVAGVCMALYPWLDLAQRSHKGGNQ